MAQNPYTLVFGKEPAQMIPRIAQVAEILESFQGENPSQQVFIITGVRGSGKTVLMTEVSREIALDESWIVVELNPERDMLQALAAKLSSEHELAQLFKTAKINLSFFGFGLEVGGVAPITDIEVALDKMLSSLASRGRKVLVTVDEASNTSNMREFAAAFQILLRRNLPIFLLMTGLYENINVLENEKSLTFMYRAPKVITTPLNTAAMAANYQKTLTMDAPTALAMAKLTQGFPYAFQVLGYLTWREGSFGEAVTSALRHHLEEYVYEKIWSEMSFNDRRLAFGIASTPDGKVADVKRLLGVDSNHFSPYRSRLVKRGIINGDMRGYVRFTLPFFGDFVLDSFEG